MQTEPHLFRSQAIQAQQHKCLGDIILVRPLSFHVLTGLISIFAMLLASFLIVGTYTQRSTVSGQLLPSTGLVKVYPSQVGLVQEKYIVEGQSVKRGDILYVLSSERHSRTQGNTQETISRQVELRQQSVQGELGKTRLLQQEERRALMQKIATMQAELGQLDSQIEGQRLRVRLAEENVVRYRDLFARHYISKEMLQQKEIDQLDQNNRLQGLEREKIGIRRELANQQHELSGLSLRQENQLSQIDRTLINLKQELAESEAKRRLAVVAPENGTATAIIAEPGQTVDADKPLLNIIPSGANLQAQLYVPSKAIGFVKTGDTVLLRYQAYPYQKFGHANGIVAAISQTALPIGDLNLPFVPTTNGLPAASNEPLYRITVNLTRQTIDAYGKAQPLQSGMLLDADILLDRRRLYEWALEPLYSLSGKFQS